MSWLRSGGRRSVGRELATMCAFVAVAAVVIGAVRGRLFAADEQVRQEHDVYFLPPPKQVAVMSLGYRAAVADVLWAHVLVSQGLHSFERRRFENLNRLYDVINELAPTWRAPYLYADAIISFQSKVTSYEDAKKAREILERGVKHRPYDAEMWLNLGQYVAFIAAPSYLGDRPEEAKQWRIDGAKALARAAELSGGDHQWIGWQAMGASRILREAGQRDATIRFLERALAVADDEELREQLLARLEALAGEQRVAEQKRRGEAFRDAVRGYLPFVSRTTALVVGPPPHPYRCAGLGHDDSPACALSWQQWHARQGRAPAGVTDRKQDAMELASP